MTVAPPTGAVAMARSDFGEFVFLQLSFLRLSPLRESGIGRGSVVISY